MRRRPLSSITLVFALVGVAVILWESLDWPPPRLILKHGFPPAGGPTGETWEGPYGIVFVEISAGYFRMGSHVGCEPGDLLGRVSSPLGLSRGRPSKHEGASCPPHWVEISRSFWIAQDEVTNLQYEQYSGARDRSPCSDADDAPAVEVTWDAARGFCRWLSGKCGRSIRLPSEAEWEFACRAGSVAAYAHGEDAARLSEFARYGEDLSSDPPYALPVGSLRPNCWGLFDMHGNAWEWCEDRWHGNYRGARNDGAPWTSGESAKRVIRGGSWFAGAAECTSDFRYGLLPEDLLDSELGFRPAFTLDEDPRHDAAARR